MELKVQVFRCLCTNAQGLGNKKEELQLLMQKEGYYLEDITETWWYDSHGWNVVADE